MPSAIRIRCNKDTSNARVTLTIGAAMLQRIAYCSAINICVLFIYALYASHYQIA